jgi:Carboxypeptidase regulatory-like domain
MRRIAVVIVVLVCCACGSRAGAPTGGIQGRVTIGPTCPVEQAGSPCPPGAWTGTVRATSSDGAVHETTTGSDGSYQLLLAPGTYTVAPLVEGGGPPTAKPASVTVGTTMQQLDMQLDSGIR